jgi:hypothetical protein
VGVAGADEHDPPGSARRVIGCCFCLGHGYLLERRKNLVDAPLRGNDKSQRECAGPLFIHLRINPDSIPICRSDVPAPFGIEEYRHLRHLAGCRTHLRWTSFAEISSRFFPLVSGTKK